MKKANERAKDDRQRMTDTQIRCRVKSSINVHNIFVYEMIALKFVHLFRIEVIL